MHKFIYNNLNKTHESSTIYIEKKKQPNENIHQHDFTELAIIFKGRAKHIINDHENTIKAGDVFVVKGNTSHGYEDTRELVICNIIYQEKDTYNFKKLPGFQTLFVLEPSFRIKYNYESMLNLNHKELEYLDDITDIMLKEYKTKMKGHDNRIKAYFNSLIIYLSHKYTQSNTRVSKKLLKLGETLAYMEKHYLDDITLEELAKKASLSRRHFSRIFKEHYNTSPINYIIQLRINHSCSLLIETDKNITEIAIESGFNDSNYFSRKFKNIMGISPTEYRVEKH